jgi:large subunit ribosomal protein L29
VSKTGQNLEQLRDKPDDELRAELANTRDALFRLQLGQYTNQVTSTAEIQTKRRDVARIMTILRGRAIGTEKQAQKTAAAEAPAADAPAKKTTKKAKAK